MKVRIILLSSLFIVPIYSQRFTLGVGGGINLLNDGSWANAEEVLQSYWHNGVNLNLSGEYFLSPNVSLNSIAEYGYYKFDRYSETGPHIPEEWITSSSGEDSRAIRFFEEVKLYSNVTKSLQYFLATGAGYVYEKLGTITVEYYDLNFGRSTGQLRFEGLHNFVHTVEMGARIKLMSKAAADISISYYSNYKNILNTKTQIGFSYLF